MKDIFSRWFANRKNRIERRLDKTKDTSTVEPQLAASNIHYEVSDKANGLLCGGIGTARHLGVRVLHLRRGRRVHRARMRLPLRRRTVSDEWEAT